ncbi:hypothetical protein P7K49_002859, partial [Saguinus oedipus]
MELLSQPHLGNILASLGAEGCLLLMWDTQMPLSPSAGGAGLCCTGPYLQEVQEHPGNLSGRALAQPNPPSHPRLETSTTPQVEVGRSPMQRLPKNMRLVSMGVILYLWKQGGLSWNQAKVASCIMMQSFLAAVGTRGQLQETPDLASLCIGEARGRSCSRKSLPLNKPSCYSLA